MAAATISHDTATDKRIESCFSGCRESNDSLLSLSLFLSLSVHVSVFLFPFFFFFFFYSVRQAKFENSEILRLIRLLTVPLPRFQRWTRLIRAIFYFESQTAAGSNINNFSARHSCAHVPGTLSRPYRSVISFCHRWKIVSLSWPYNSIVSSRIRAFPDENLYFLFTRRSTRISLARFESSNARATRALPIP